MIVSQHAEEKGITMLLTERFKTKVVDEGFNPVSHCTVLNLQSTIATKPAQKAPLTGVSSRHIRTLLPTKKQYYGTSATISVLLYFLLMEGRQRDFGQNGMVVVHLKVYGARPLRRAIMRLLEDTRSTVVTSALSRHFAILLGFRGNWQRFSSWFSEFGSCALDIGEATPDRWDNQHCVWWPGRTCRIIPQISRRGGR
eukprot:2508776-Amphidinium_carterae.2